MNRPFVKWRLANYLLVTILCSMAMFILMTLQRMALQDTRIKALEDSIHETPR